MKKKLILILAVIAAYSLQAADAPKPTLPGGDAKWRLVWSDEFDYSNIFLESSWISQNAPSTHILSSRWRENAVVSDGTLKLQARKESRGGQNWTAGNIWTKQHFQYGYYECRYKYAAATGTNNSFWLMTTGTTPTVGKKFEIDINEGHYPAEMNTNIHNWTDITTNPTTGAQTHPSASKTYNFSQAPDVTIQLEIPVTTQKVRLRTNYPAHFHIREFRIYGINPGGYPKALSATADTDITGLVNFARSSTISVSGVYSSSYPAPGAADGTLTTSWVSQPTGEKWIEFDLGSSKTIGCIQFVSGWVSNGQYVSVLDQYNVEYFDGSQWVSIATLDAKDAKMNFGRDYNYFGLEWTADSLKFYFNGRVMRAEKNVFCHSPAPIYLSLAIISWAGAVTDAIHGTQMEVDYVRVYKPVVPSEAPYEHITNGGFEVTTTGQTGWEMSRDILNYTSYSWLKTDPADGLVSMRIKSEASENPFGAILGQKVVLEAGEYLFRFKARSGNVTPEANKFVFKFSNMFSDRTMFMNDTLPRVVVPSSEWTSYSYKLNLKQDYSGKITFGFGNAGTFDLDSISLIRLGDAVVSAVDPLGLNKAKVYAHNNYIVVNTETNQYVEVFTLDGSKLMTTKMPGGEHKISINRTGIFIVRLRNELGIITRKVILGSGN
jgi:beta-glucanase (GH16 family)